MAIPNTNAQNDCSHWPTADVGLQSVPIINAEYVLMHYHADLICNTTSGWHIFPYIRNRNECVKTETQVATFLSQDNIYWPRQMVLYRLKCGSCTLGLGFWRDVNIGRIIGTKIAIRWNRINYTQMIGFPTYPVTDTILWINYCISHSNQVPELRWMVGLLTGHSHLKGHFFKLGRMDDPTCERCLEEHESATHVLCDCEAIAHLWFRHLGTFFMEPSDYYDAPLSKVLRFIRSVD
jgi:hypothetical protein